MNHVQHSVRPCVAVAICAAISLVFLTSCASTTATTSGAKPPTVPPSIAGKSLRPDLGTVVSTREVVIDGEATLVGRSAGIGVGAAVGQTVGSGDGRILASAGGAVAGAIVGGMVEKELSKKRAQEITISLDDGPTLVVIQELEDGGFIDGDRVIVVQTVGGEARVSRARYESDGIY